MSITIGHWIGARSLSVLAVSQLAITAAAAQGGVESYCEGGGSGIALRAEGSASLEANEGHGDLVLVAENASSPFGWFVMGDLRLMRPPFGAGSLCVAGSRGVLSAVAVDVEQQIAHGETLTFAKTWMLRHTLDYLEGDALGGAVQAGSTWNFQLVQRAGAELATSNALSISFGPAVELAGWKTIEQGVHSSHPEAGLPSVLVIDDAQSWSDFQVQHKSGNLPGLQTPVADWANELVLVVFAGTASSSGVELEIVALALSVTTLDIATESTTPGVGCGILPLLTHPYHVVRIPRIEGLEIGAWSNTVLRGEPCR